MCTPFCEQVPIVHILDCTIKSIANGGGSEALCLGLIGTKGTIASTPIRARLNSLGVRQVLVNKEEEQDELIMPCIDAVKEGRLESAAVLLERAVKSLLLLGATKVILACTELPVVLDRIDKNVRDACVDPTRALARGCVQWWNDNMIP